MKTIIPVFAIAILLNSTFRQQFDGSQEIISATPFDPTLQCDVPEKSRHLFPVGIDRKIGFIDSSGILIIPPIYESAGNFSAGLCAVRLHGLYGFINLRGDFAISANFDFATEFKEGLALVYQGNKPCFIDKSGTIVIGPHYEVMKPFQRGKSKVKTYSGKWGMINQSGKLIMDTVYYGIGRFEDGFCVASKPKPSVKPAGRNPETIESIVDSTGNPVVPFGRYNNIEGPWDGFYIAEKADEKNGTSGQVILNNKGEITYELRPEEYTWSSIITDGTLRVNRHVGESESDKYEAYLTPYGEVIFDNPLVRYAKDFTGNLAFWEDDSSRMHLINRRGKELATFDELIGDGFKNGLAVVRVGDSWGIIDTTLTFVVKPKFRKVHDLGIVQNFILFEDPDYGLSNENTNPKYGLADLGGNILIEPSFEFFDDEGFRHGLLKTSVNERITYYNLEGRSVWNEEVPHLMRPFALNIDYMQRGYFYAAGGYTGHPYSYGAEPFPISPFHKFAPSALSVTVVPGEEVVVDGVMKGIRTYVANSTGYDLHFNAQDNRLYMKMQAMNSNHEWVDIEYLPNSWCGNSYHSVELPANHFWEFAALSYEGSVKTRMRIELTVVDPTDTKGLRRPKKNTSLDWRYRNRRELKIYSNEFDGTVNPAQFWRKVDYYPMGLMDPYNE